jgi:hypothetical protein
VERSINKLRVLNVDHLYLTTGDPLPVRGYQKGAAIILLSVLIYQIMVYYNCITGNKQPKAIKHMLGS